MVKSVSNPDGRSNKCSSYIDCELSGYNRTFVGLKSMFVVDWMTLGSDCSSRCWSLLCSSAFGSIM